MRTVLLAKAQVKAHTRTLPSGKVVQVKAYADKRSKKAGEQKKVKDAASSPFKVGSKIKDKWGDTYVVQGDVPNDPSRILVREEGALHDVMVPRTNFEAAENKPKPARKAAKPAKAATPIGDTADGAIPADAWPASGQEPIILFHRTNEKDGFEVKGTGMFGGIFAGPRAGMEGDYEHAVILDPEKNLDSYALKYNVDYDDYSSAVDKALPGLSDEEKEVLFDYISEEKNVFDDDESEWSEILGQSDTADASWELQRIRGVVAKELGYQSVEMKDETGISTLVLPGQRTYPIANFTNYGNAESEIYEQWERWKSGGKALTKSFTLLTLTGKQ